MFPQRGKGDKIQYVVRVARSVENTFACGTRTLHGVNITERGFGR